MQHISYNAKRCDLYLNSTSAHLCRLIQRLRYLIAFNYLHPSYVYSRSFVERRRTMRRLFVRISQITSTDHKVASNFFRNKIHTISVKSPTRADPQHVVRIKQIFAAAGTQALLLVAYLHIASNFVFRSLRALSQMFESGYI
jgi:hypothetical protein